ncbi:MAG: GNAT family N-acetyltransferase [Planctomycetia bacterium]|nr:GNAT family N-acetyltransferase [Planctomycetia bacterium]
MTSTKLLSVSTPITDSFRVRQIEGMFDVPINEKAISTFEIEIPPIDDKWKIGLIVGPSGSGKSTVAKCLYKDEICERFQWNENQAVIDGFGQYPIKDIIKSMSMVGFSSPPSWIKPYQVLSNGEKFRCDLARALIINDRKRIVIDEFTSVVDRTVAKVCSAAIAKSLKSDWIKKQFVAISCHYDIIEWLEPDWVLDMATCKISWRSLRRPKIHLEVKRCSRKLWPIFARHHYLNASLSNSSQCYLAVWDKNPVAFCALLPVMGQKGRKRVSRIVTLPDYQGIGIGSALLNAIGNYLKNLSIRLNITAAHPVIVAYCSKSNKWKTISIRKNNIPSIQFNKMYKGAAGRNVVSFEYLG